MNPIKVEQISIMQPIKAVGKTFTGDYGKSPKFIEEVQNELNKESIRYFPNKVLGIYYDNPFEKKAEELRSFQAVILSEPQQVRNNELTVFELKGNYIYTKVVGDPGKALMDGYNALFAFLNQKALTLKSPAGYQISTFQDGVITTQIYLELK